MDEKTKYFYLQPVADVYIPIVCNYQYRGKITHVGSSLPYLKINQQVRPRYRVIMHFSKKYCLKTAEAKGPKNEGSRVAALRKKVGHSGLEIWPFFGYLRFLGCNI